MILDMKLQRQRLPALNLEQESHARHNQIDGEISHVLADATALARAEGEMARAQPRHLLVRHVDPPLGLEDQRLRVEVRAPMHGPRGDADLDFRWDVVPVDEAAVGGFASQVAGHAGRHAERFLDAGFEVLAACQFGTVADLVDAGEGGSNLVLQLGVAFWVSGQVEEETGQRGPGGIAGCWMLVSLS